MTDLDITLRLPKGLVEKARANGMLTDDYITRLLQVELERVEAWRTLDQSFAPARAAFRADHADLDEDQVSALIDNIIHDRDASDKNTDS